MPARCAARCRSPSSSVESVLPLEISITRMAATNGEKADREKGDEGDERTENRTMGRKHRGRDPLLVRPFCSELGEAGEVRSMSGVIASRPRSPLRDEISISAWSLKTLRRSRTSAPVSSREPSRPKRVNREQRPSRTTRRSCKAADGAGSSPDRGDTSHLLRSDDDQFVIGRKTELSDYQRVM
jgi:hypothetical protein